MIPQTARVRTPIGVVVMALWTRGGTGSRRTKESR